MRTGDVNMLKSRSEKKVHQKQEKKEEKISERKKRGERESGLERKEEQTIPGIPNTSPGRTKRRDGGFQ